MTAVALAPQCLCERHRGCVSVCVCVGGWGVSVGVCGYVCVCVPV